MTSYADVARLLAERIASGAIPEGARLPSVRTIAAESGASQATAQRAYRELASWGVIETSSRRTGEVVAGAAATARRRLLGRATFRLAAGDDPALRPLLAAVDDVVLVTVEGGSGGALRALRGGRADGAAIHLEHVDGRGNDVFARAAVGEPTSILHLWRREMGLVAAPGNPHRVRSGSDLAGLRVARQPVGAGGRGTLDRLTQRAGIELDASDPVVPTAVDVAIAVATGSADVGVGIASIARAYGLVFVPLGSEVLEVALATSLEGRVAPLQAALATVSVRGAIEALGGYDLADAGAIRRLS